MPTLSERHCQGSRLAHPKTDAMLERLMSLGAPDRIWRNGARPVPDPYEPFFLRSAHLSSSLTTPVLLAAVLGELAPSNTSMSRLILSLSCFKSATILSRSKIGSSYHSLI
jgi:hypothetical protein